MKLRLVLLSIIALVLGAAGSAFADSVWSLSIENSTIHVYANTENFLDSGYLYLQYSSFDGTDSTATLSNFQTDGTLGVREAGAFPGSDAQGDLPGDVVFSNVSGLNDYNQGIDFGSYISFDVLFKFLDPGYIGGAAGSSTFSMGLFSDAAGATPALSSAFADFNNDGTVVTPEPSSLLLLAPGLLGLLAIRRNKK
jgi:hypothetical protein